MSFQGGEIQEIVISGYEDVRFPRYGRRQNPRVIRISDLDGIGLRGPRDYVLLSEKLLRFVYESVRRVHPGPQHPAELIEVELAGNQLVLKEDEAKDVGTQTTGRERADEYVRVQEHPHETVLNTSSSVR